MAETRKVGDLTVNDGNGLMDTEGFIDSIIYAANVATKQLIDGNYLAFCGTQNGLAHKLLALKDGLKKERAENKKQLEQLQKVNADLCRRLSGMEEKKEVV